MNDVGKKQTNKRNERRIESKLNIGIRIIDHFQIWNDWKEITYIRN